jgi:hypothetical protein
MKYIITENRLNNVVTQWLNDNYGDLEIEKTPHYIFYNKNGTHIFDYQPITRQVTIIGEEIQNILINMFNVNTLSLNKIFIPWFKERYNRNPRIIVYTEWYCTKCGRYHITKDHVE